MLSHTKAEKIYQMKISKQIESFPERILLHTETKAEGLASVNLVASC